MNGLPNESKKRMLPKDLIDSPSMDEGISEESLNVGHQVLKKGPWTSAEDAILVDYVKKHGEGNWNAVQKHTGLSRCGKSCRLRWANHLRPNLKKGAFTQEEEQMIIELHAKMGNKWARMAAYLPGRTDNEIKNYWNTRIKRRQRAGLPLYPPNIRLQVSDTNQQSKNISEYGYGGKQHSELFQESNFDFHDVTRDSLDANLMVLPYAPPFLDIAIGNILSQNFGSHGYGSTNPISYYTKQPRDSEGYGTSCGRLLTNEQVFSEPSRKIYRTFGLDYPYDPDPSIKSLVPLGGASPSRHSLLNGTFSASSPVSGTVKLELPSLQYTDIVGSSWPASSSTPLEVANAFVESSATCISLQSECDSRRNSGLLEALIHEAQALGSEKKQASDKCSSSSIFTPNDIVECSGFSEKVEEHNDPISPLAHSTSSILSEYNYPICGSSLHEFPHLAVSSTSGNSVSASEHASTTHFVDKGIQLCGDCSRPDVLLGSMQLQDSSQSAKDNSVFNDAIAILLGKDLYQYQPLLSEAPSILEQGLDIDPRAWDNMPPAYQMP